jgi:hypothetical protein
MRKPVAESTSPCSRVTAWRKQAKRHKIDTAHYRKLQNVDSQNYLAESSGNGQEPR